MVKKVTFHIDSNGEVEIRVQGAQGNECEKMTEPFESALGVIARKTYTDSYYHAVEGTEASPVLSESEKT